MILEIKNDNIKISKVKVANDEPLEGVPKPLPTWNYFSLLVGGPGSGKTTLMISLIKKYYKKKYDHIYLFSGSLQTLPDNFISKLNPDRIFSNLDNLKDIIEQLKNDIEKPKVLMVFDDLVKPIEDNKKIIMDLAYNRRHIGGGISLLVITQKLNKIPLMIRTAVDTIYFFNLNNKREINSLFDDYIENLDENEFNSIIKHINNQSDSHRLLFIDKKNGFYYNKFNKLVIEKDLDN